MFMFKGDTSAESGNLSMFSIRIAFFYIGNSLLGNGYCGSRYPLPNYKCIVKHALDKKLLRLCMQIVS